MKCSLIGITIHEIKNKTEFVHRVKCICHANNKWTTFFLEKPILCLSWFLNNKFLWITYACADKWKHNTFIQCQCFTLFHFNTFLIETFHCIPSLKKKIIFFFVVSAIWNILRTELTEQYIHFSCIGFSTTVNFTKATTTNDSMNTEIIHC